MKFERKIISWAKIASSERNKDRFSPHVYCWGKGKEGEGWGGRRLRLFGVEGLCNLKSVSWNSSQEMHLYKLHPIRVDFYPFEIGSLYICIPWAIAEKTKKPGLLFCFARRALKSFRKGCISILLQMNRFQPISHHSHVHHEFLKELIDELNRSSSFLGSAVPSCQKQPTDIS